MELLAKQVDEAQEYRYSFNVKLLVPWNTFQTIYKALLSSYLSYGIVAGGQAAKTHANQLFLLQKRALRWMYFGHYTAHAIPHFLSSNILPLNMLYFKSVAILKHDITKNLAPDQVHAYNARSSWWLRN